MTRISRDAYGLQVARAVAARADCTRRQVGAVVMDDEGRIVSTGYNGAPAGEPGCASEGACPRGRLSYDEHPHGVAYEAGESRCIAVHAEANAIVYAGRERTKGCTIYVTDEPCYLCALIIKAAGITRVVVAPKEEPLKARPWPEVRAERAYQDGSSTSITADGIVHRDPDGREVLRMGTATDYSVVAAPFPVHRITEADALWLTPERRAAWERAREDGSEGTA